MAERETCFGWNSIRLQPKGVIVIYSPQNRLAENAHHGCGCRCHKALASLVLWGVSLGRSENPIRLVCFIGHHSAKRPIVSSSNFQLGLLWEMKKATSNIYNHESYDGGRGMRAQHNVEKLW